MIFLTSVWIIIGVLVAFTHVSSIALFVSLNANKLITNFVQFCAPIAYHKTITFCFFIFKTDLCWVRLHNSILFLFSHTIYQKCWFTLFRDFWARSNLNWSFILLYIFIIFKFTIRIQLEKSYLFIAVPVLFA